MKLTGASATDAKFIVAQLVEAAFFRHAALIVLDGEDVTAVFGDDSEPFSEVVTLARRVVPELAA